MRRSLGKKSALVGTAETLENEEEVLRQIQELREANRWIDRRVLKPWPDPPRNKTHWDHFLLHVEARADEFHELRAEHGRQCRATARQASQHLKSKDQAVVRKVKEEEQHIRRLARDASKMIKKFWDEMEQLLNKKYERVAEERRQRNLKIRQQKILEGTKEILDRVKEDLGGSDDENSDEDEDAEDTIELEEKMERAEGCDAQRELLELQKNFEEEPDEVDLETLRAQLANMDDKGNILNPDIAMPDSLKEAPPVEDEQLAQPIGTDLSTATVTVGVPPLMNPEYTLRPYQHIGLDWLAKLHKMSVNGILADEMGLGKTIQTIALLAHLAYEEQNWGPHLIVVPTSVLLNWEIECKRWCPSFKILTYHGSKKRREELRQGWNRPNAFHICITSYSLILSDAAAFKRKRWVYLILDEAQNIKNWKSQKWQTLLNFNSDARLLLTGTPLQNNLLELWSLLHFLMPHADAFQSREDFRELFSLPVEQMVQGARDVSMDVISKLHSVLQPFILRRLKRDVEKQMPKKIHRVAKCRLSKRQRMLYDEFMSLNTTKDSLCSGSYAAMISVLGSLRKVCNHPDLFETRTIDSPFDMIDPISQEAGKFRLQLLMPRIACTIMELVDKRVESLQWMLSEVDQYHLDFISERKVTPQLIVELADEAVVEPTSCTSPRSLLPSFLSPSATTTATTTTTTTLYHHTGTPKVNVPNTPHWNAYRERLHTHRHTQLLTRCERIGQINTIRCDMSNKFLPIPGSIVHTIKNMMSVPTSSLHHQLLHTNSDQLWPHDMSCSLRNLVLTNEQRMESGLDIVKNYTCYIPKARANHPRIYTRLPIHSAPHKFRELQKEDTPMFPYNKLTLYREPFARTQMRFPDKRLLQYDCGKLQVLARLLTLWKRNKSKVLIFTQMSKVLDLLEIFLCMHGHSYLRLDGSTKIEQRMTLMERFNNDPRVFCFILSTRSGGVGINLTGANVVVFYDMDWNPAMDLQAQDRAHRIGQTRDVYIYRLISQHTIEENIYKKVQEKKMLVNVTLKGGTFNSVVNDKIHVADLFHGYDEDLSADEVKRLQQMAGENVEESAEPQSKRRKITVTPSAVTPTPATTYPPSSQLPPPQLSSEKTQQAEESQRVGQLATLETEEVTTAPTTDYHRVQVSADEQRMLLACEDEEDRLAYQKAIKEVEADVNEVDEGRDNADDLDNVDTQVQLLEFDHSLPPLRRRCLEILQELKPDFLTEVIEYWDSKYAEEEQEKPKKVAKKRKNDTPTGKEPASKQQKQNDGNTPKEKRSGRKPKKKEILDK